VNVRRRRRGADRGIDRPRLQQRLGASVTGYDPAAEVCEEALRRGAIGAVAASAAEPQRCGHRLSFAAPVSALAEAIDTVLAAAGGDCAVSDVGSTKRELIAGRSDERFIGGHPLAGAETSGVEHARGRPVRRRDVVSDAGARDLGRLYQRLHKALAGIGAKPTAIDAADHDRVMASVSHLRTCSRTCSVAQAAAGAVG